MMLWRNTINELLKIATKIRSYIGIGALTLLILIVIFAMKADGKSYIGFVTASFEQTLSFNGKILNGNLIADRKSTRLNSSHSSVSRMPSSA